MLARGTTLALCLLLCLPAALGGCKSEEDGGGGGGGGQNGLVSISASSTSVVANGTNFVNITVNDTAGGPINVTTTRGTFAGTGGSTSVVVPGATGVVTLVTCDASGSTTCAGAAIVRASHGGASASVTVTFGSLTAVCPTNCSADPGCAGMSCEATGGETGTCSATTPSQCTTAPACTPTETSESTCSGGVDEDCDGDVDCEDADCDNQQCQPGSPAFICQSDACTDSASGLAITVTPGRTRLPANGTATTAVEVRVTSSGSAAEGVGVTLASSIPGTIGAATGTTNGAGIATFTFTAPNAPATATLTAAIAGLTPAITAQATITMPALGALLVPQTSPVEHTVLGATGSGFQEVGYVAVKVVDDQNQPYPDGVAVRFEHRQLGGSTFAAPPPLAPDTAGCAAALGCVGLVAGTTSGAGDPDTQGLASAWLRSGSIAGSLVTTATATVAGVTRTITLPTVTVVGAKASGANFSVVCGPRNVPALAETDCAISLVDAPFTCRALLKDRFNNVLGRETQVLFTSETAAVGQVVTTPPYDPAGGPSADLGTATQSFETMGAGLPFDVAPQAGEPSSDHGADGCGTRTHNPRDGVVTVLAVADGEEAFFDADGSGAYDLGEPFVDQGEPFLDQDDSGAWEPGEWFLDVDGDRGYTPGDGEWTAAAKIWTQTATVYTGHASTVFSGGNVLGTRFVDGGPPADACTATPPATPFLVFAEQQGPPVVPPTTVAYGLVASDMNLNFLHQGTEYAAGAMAGNVDVGYGGLSAIADHVGFFYRYWPCDGAGNCASQCRAAPADLPCVMQPSISGFSCGYTSFVTITGGSDPGTDVVEWDVSTTYSVYQETKTVNGGVGLFGQSL